MAMNCWVVPLAMLGLVGVIAMDTRVAGVTVRVVDTEMFFKVAVIVVEPTAREMACPWEPAALLIDATPVLDELQVDLCGQILRRIIGERACGRELLGCAFGDPRVSGSDRYRHRFCAGDSDLAAAVNTAGCSCSGLHT